MTPQAAVLLLQLAQGIVVETDSPDAHCPDLHQTRAAVNARLGTIQSEGFRARYNTVRVRGDAPRDFVLLELYAPGGDVRVRRELPIGESCGAISEAIALVLDEYFRALVTPDDEAATEDTTTPLPPPVPEKDSIAETRPTPRAAEPRAWRIMPEISINSHTSSVGLGARLDRRLAASWHAGLEVMLPLRERTESLSMGAEARARSFELNAQLGWGKEFGVLRPYVATALFSSIERGSTSAPLSSSTHYRWLGGAGLELGTSVRLRGPWQSFAFASGGRIFIESADFFVGSDEVLSAIDWVGKLGFGLAYTF